MAQSADDLAHRVLLEQADGGDAGGASVQAIGSILELYSSQREHWNLRFASLSEFDDACRLHAGVVFFLKQRSEDRKRRVIFCGLRYLLW